MGKFSIIFTAKPSLLFKIISWFTKSDVSHVMLGYEDPVWGGKWTAASDLDGVRLYRAEQTCKYVVYEFECLFDTSKGVEAVRNLINEPYDFLDLFAIGYVLLMWRWFKRKVKFPWHNADRQICSEFASRFLIGCGTPQTSTWDPEAISPSILKDYCLRYSDLFRLKQSLNGSLG